MPRLPRAERAAQTRADLLAAAARVFARRGYAGASIADIAEEAGYSHGAVYSNFAGKQDLFFTLFEQRAAETVAMLTTFFATAQGSFLDKARALADESQRHLREDPDRFLLNLEFSIVAARDPELRARFVDRIEAIPRAIGELIGAEQRAGRVAQGVNAAELALGLHALGVGLGIDQVIAPGQIRQDLYSDLVVRLIAGAIPAEG